MLHFARGVTFGVDVGNFLQFERAFERDGEERETAEEKEIGMGRVALGDFLDARGLFQRAAHQV